MLRIARWILNHPLIAVLILLIPTAYFAWRLPELEVNNDIPTLFHRDDPERLFYEDFYKEFGNDEFLAVYFAHEDVFDLRILQMVDRLTKRLEKLSNVDQVLSLTNFRSAYNKGDTLIIGALEEELGDLQPSDMPAIRERIMSDPLYYKTLLIPRDGKGATIVIPLKRLSSTTYKSEIIQEVRHIIAEEKMREGIDIVIGSTPFYLVAMDEAYKKDNRVMTPILLGIVFFVLFAIFRNLWVPFIPLLVAGLSVIWTFGFIVTMGQFATPLTQIILPLELVYCVLNSVHLLSAYRQRFQKGTDYRDVILDVVKQVAIPCLWASVTTAMGFLSLMTSSVVSVQDLGFYAAFGIMVSYFLTFVFLPLGLTRLKWAPSKEKEEDTDKAALLREITINLFGFANRYKKSVVVGTCGVIALSVFWARHITIDTNYLSMFRQNSEVIRNERMGSKLIGSWAPLEFSIRYHDGESILEPAALKEIEKIQVYLESLPSIDKSLSVADIVKKANQELHGGGSEFYVVPTSRIGIERLVIFTGDMGGQRGMSSYLSGDQKRMRLTASTSILPSKEFVELFDQIEKYIKQNIDSKLNIKITGDLALGQKLTVRILNTEIQSFSLAFFVIFIVMIFALKSWRLALLTIPANIFPVIIVLAAMNKANIALDVGTCTIASIVISMAVDDTIHILHRFREELIHKKDYEAAYIATLRVVGPSVVYTSIVLTAGFWTLVFSSFIPMVNFGLLSGIAVIAALVGDIIILSALVMWIKPIRFPSSKVVVARGEDVIQE